MNWMLRFPSTENSSGWKPNRPAEDYGKYASLCEKLKVTSDRLLLVNSDLSVEECEGVSYFWNYRVANCATITQELENMIAKQIESAGNAALSID